ncbi:alpha/beta fold hydrolase [Dermacoccus sp. Tok2021]|uniref:alpha/beta hydrolase family protein n=1 Tax=Dermacoccus sp. Tok2021 TaxID=2826873 RepID=UPI001CA7AB8E|nr:alpha/beta fold hydrolase [Dermacoccus sp. Tok2021]
MESFRYRWPDPKVEALEHQALERLLSKATQNGPLGPLEYYGDNRNQVFETVGKRGNPVILLIHGGFFRPSIDRRHLRPLAHAVADLGWYVVLAEYQRPPGEPFTEIRDVLMLERHLRATFRPPSRVVGHSAGGLLALLRALSPASIPLPQVEIVALAAVTDPMRAAVNNLGDGAIESWIGASPQGRPGTYSALSPDRLVRQGKQSPAKIYLAHGRLDATVPFTYTRDLAALMRITSRGEGIHPPSQELVLSFPETAHHIDIIDPSRPDTMLNSWWQPLIDSRLP